MKLSQKIRFFIPSFIFVLACLLLTYMLWTLAVNRRGFLLDQSKQRVERRRIISPSRQKILDSNGNILAISLPRTSFYVQPEKLLQDQSASFAVAKLFNKDPNAFMDQLKHHKNKHFMFLARQLDAAKSKVIKDSASAYVLSQEEYARVYPEGQSISQILGVTNLDGFGIEGVELAHNKQLLGEAGYKETIVNRFGQEVEVLSDTKAKSGENITLTIDKELQHSVYMALQDGVQRSSAKSGLAMVVAVESGDILAAAHYPSFDPHDRVRDLANRKSRIFTDLIEPGSTFKPIAMGYVLDNTTVAMDEMWDTSPGHIQLNGNTVEDVRNYGMITTQDIMVKSSNVGMAKLVLKAGGFPQWLRDKLQLHTKSGVHYPGEVSGGIAPVRDEDTFGTATLSFGYGLNMSAAQLAKLYTAIASGGVVKPLRLVRGEPDRHKPYRLFSEATTKKLHTMMRMAVSSKGTGRLSADWGGEVAGKTGTTYLHTAKGYDKSSYVASFAGFAPVKKPKYVVIVVVFEPDKKRHFGGQVAAPIFSNIMFNAMYLTNGLQNTVF